MFFSFKRQFSLSGYSLLVGLSLEDIYCALHCSKNACITRAVQDWVSFPDHHCADLVSNHPKFKIKDGREVEENEDSQDDLCPCSRVRACVP